MENLYSNPPEPTPLSDTSEQMPNFNNLFQEGVPKMMRVTDDLHQMVDYIRNMMIGLALLNMIIVLALLTIIGILIFLILKYRNGKQIRRRRSNRGKYRFVSSLNRNYSRSTSIRVGRSKTMERINGNIVLNCSNTSVTIKQKVAVNQSKEDTDDL